MNKPKPKFCVGEEVEIRSTICPQNNTAKTEITEQAFRMGFPQGGDKEKSYLLWVYKTDSCQSYVGETSLRKLPPEDRTQWSDCEWMPRETVK